MSAAEVEINEVEVCSFCNEPSRVQSWWDAPWRDCLNTDGGRCLLFSGDDRLHCNDFMCAECGGGGR